MEMEVIYSLKALICGAELHLTFIKQTNKQKKETSWLKYLTSGKIFKRYRTYFHTVKIGIY